MQIDISDLNIPLAISRVKRDMRDDWFADPLQYRDILKGLTEVKMDSMSKLRIRERQDLQDVFLLIDSP